MGRAPAINGRAARENVRGRGKWSQRGIHITLGLYVVLFAIVIPLLTPLRISQVVDPAVIRNATLPILVVLAVFTFGIRQIIVPKSWYHGLLLVVFVVAAALGFDRAGDPDTTRYYLSHLFQIASAYVMFAAGWSAFDRITHRFWKYSAILALIFTYVATAITLVAYQRDSIGVVYTASYLFILVTAYSAHYSNRMSLLAIMGTAVSNKRGPIISLIFLFIQNFASGVASGELARQRRLGKYLLRALLVLAVMTVSGIFVVSWASDPSNQDLAFARVVNTTFRRLASIMEFNAGNAGIDRITSGRSEEVAAALDTLRGFDWVFGSGAGWTTIWRQQIIQNIHFTPLSLTAVFGAPFAIATYVYLSQLVVKATLRKVPASSLTTSERMAPLYLTGAVVHSLIAYSLFIDLFVFFFAGVLARSLQVRASERKRRVRRETPARPPEPAMAPGGLPHSPVPTRVAPAS